MAERRSKQRSPAKRQLRPKSNGRAERADLERLAKALEVEGATWEPVDLRPIIAGEQTTDPPSVLSREDGTFLLYRGLVHSLYGEPEAGKGWVALKAAAEELDNKGRVVYIDFEDEAATAVERLRALEVEPEAVADRFCYLRPDESLRGEKSQAAFQAALEPPPSLVVIDGMTEALALEGTDLNDNTDVAKWITAFPRRVAYHSGAAVLIIDHQTKDGESRGRFAIGAQHKLAGIHVAYSIKALKPFGRGLNGSSRVKVEKDRLGHVRKHAEEQVIAEVAFISDPDGPVSVELKPPNPSRWRPTAKMEQVSAYLEEESGGQSRAAVLRAVGGKEKTVDEAIRHLRSEGYIRVVSEGKGKSTRHYPLKSYRAPAEEPK